jgi:hypothetical protein
MITMKIISKKANNSLPKINFSLFCISKSAEKISPN